jgi:hypothetical protein
MILITILKDNDIPYYGRQHEWHDNRDLIYNDIDNWARDFFYKRYGVKKDLIEDVVKLNRHYNVNKYFTDSFTVEYNYNIFEYCEHQDTKLKKSKTTYQISNRMPWKDDADFNQLIYRRARHGFNIRDFKRIEA